MYPSGNPFEYGNQPLSTLEQSQALKAESVRSEPEPLPLNRTPENGPTQGYEMGQFTQQPTFIPQPEHSWQSSGDRPDLGTYAMPPRPPGMDQHIGSHPTFWQQLAQGPPGLTPGVGMDDVFTGGNWNAMYMDPEGRPPGSYGQ